MTDLSFARPAPLRPPPSDGRRAALSALRSARRVVAIPHAPVDGDGLGSALALQHALRATGRESVVVVPATIATKYRFLPGAEEVLPFDAELPFRPDLYVALDGNSRDRFGQALPTRPTVPCLVVDHHTTGNEPSRRFAAVEWIDPAYAATGLMVHELLRELAMPIGPEAALCLYTTLVTDTGRFSYANTTPEVHRAAAALIELGARPEVVLEHVYRGLTRGQILLRADVAASLETENDGRLAWTRVTPQMCARRGVTPSDAHDLVEIAASLRGVRLSALFREREGAVHVSLRSPGEIDVAAIARRFGGGGHARAAGFRLAAPIDDVQARVLPVLREVEVATR